jgi:hypothetical protein
MPPSYGNYYRGGTALYEANSQQPTWLTALEEGVGAFLSVREKRKADKERKDAEAAEASRKNLQLNAQIAMGNAGIDAMMTEQEEDRKAKAAAAALVAEKAKREQERDSVARQLLERFAKTGGRQEAALLASIGVPAATLNAVRPAPEPESKEDAAYQTTKGRLRAQQEMGAGDFRPKTPKASGSSASAGNYTPLQLRTMAGGALRTAAEEALDAYPTATATTVIRAIMDNPSYAEINDHPAWARELTSKVDAELAAARARRQSKARAGTTDYSKYKK